MSRLGRAVPPLTALAAVLILCAPFAGSAADREIEIPTILSLTGQAAFIGTTYQKTLVGLETVINRNGGIKGQPIHFAFSDDQSNPQTSVQLMNVLLARKVNAVLGPNLTGTCRAVAPLLTNGPADYCLSPGIHPSKGSYVFSVGVDTRDQIQVVLRYLRLRGWRNVAMIVTTDATGQDAEEAFSEALKQPENQGTRFVAVEHFNVSDQSVAAQLVRIAAAKPEVIIAWATGTPMTTIMRGMLDGGNRLPVLINNANAVSTQMKSYEPILPADLYTYGPPYMVATPNPRASSFEKNYFDALKVGGLENDYLTGLVWDPAIILADAIEKLGATAGSTQIRDYIEGLRKWKGLAGSYDFTDGSQRGLTQQEILIMRWDHTKHGWGSASKLGGTL